MSDRTAGTTPEGDDIKVTFGVGVKLGDNVFRQIIDFVGGPLVATSPNRQASASTPANSDDNDGSDFFSIDPFAEDNGASAPTDDLFGQFRKDAKNLIDGKAGTVSKLTASLLGFLTDNTGSVNPQDIMETVRQCAREALQTQHITNVQPDSHKMRSNNAGQTNQPTSDPGIPERRATVPTWDAIRKQTSSARVVVGENGMRYVSLLPRVKHQLGGNRVSARITVSSTHPLTEFNPAFMAHLREIVGASYETHIPDMKHLLNAGDSESLTRYKYTMPYTITTEVASGVIVEVTLTVKAALYSTAREYTHGQLRAAFRPVRSQIGLAMERATHLG